MRLRKGAFGIRYAGEAGQNYFAGWEREVLRPVFPFDQNEISDLAVWPTIERRMQWDAVVERNEVGPWDSTCAEEQVEGKHALQGSDGPVALLRDRKGKLHAGAGLPLRIITARFLIPRI